jgi:hypothetical protein
MPKQKRYIPLRDDDFFNFQGNLVNLVVANKSAWGIPDSAVNPLVARRVSFEPLYTTAQNKTTRSRADVLAHRQSRKLYEKEIRTFVKAYLLYNPLVTDEQRSEMALTIRDTEPSPHPVITDIPIVALRVIGGGDIDARCKALKDQTRPSMLSSANLIDYRYVMLEIGARPPANAEDYTKRDVSSRAKFIIRVGAQNEGKRFYAVFRWINTTKPKQEGPWSEAQTVVIA